MINTKLSQETYKSREINAYLTNLISILEPTQKQREKIQFRLNRIREHLEELDCTVIIDGLFQSTYLQGSWKRHTMIRKSLQSNWDVDILVVMGSAVPNWSPRSNGESLSQPRSKLQTLKQNLKNYYPNMDLHRDYPCLTLHYQDDNLDLELMPVYVFDTQRYYSSYNDWSRVCNDIYIPKEEYRIFYIPNSEKDDSWMYSRTFWFDKELSKQNSALNGKLVRLIKLLKHWNNQNGYYLKGYEIERFSVEFSQKNYLKLGSFIEMIRKWFEMMLTYLMNDFDVDTVEFETFDPSFKTSGTIKQSLLNKINQAITIIEANDISQWKSIFPYI